MAHLGKFEIGGLERLVPLDVGYHDRMFDHMDLLVDEYYCKHDVFIGSPFGRDYLCPFCEDGG